MATENTHPKALLPWYVNATLSGDELAHVENHVKACETCQAEIELLKKMREVVKEPVEQGPGEFALHRLMHEIKKETRRQPKFSRWWQPALAASALLVIVLQGIFIINMRGQVETFVPAGEQAPIRILFVEQTSAKSIQEALHSVSAVIVDGPSAIGLYAIAFTDTPSDDEIEERVNRLRTQKHIVSHIQSD